MVGLAVERTGDQDRPSKGLMYLANCVTLRWRGRFARRGKMYSRRIRGTDLSIKPLLCMGLFSIF